MRNTLRRSILGLLPLCLLAVGCSSTLRAHSIELVDENGEPQIFMTATTTGAAISIGLDDKDDTTLNLGVVKSGQNHEGPASAFIQAESGKIGHLTVSVDPSGAHLYMGSDNTDGFQITSDQNGLLVAMGPKGETGVDAKASETAGAPVSKEARGVRITIDKGRLVVHDLAGHELAVVPESVSAASGTPH